MNSSCANDCKVPSKSYPTTKYIKGDKTFGELKVGDKLYIAVFGFGYNKYETLTVSKECHIYNGKIYITCVGCKHHICLGSADNENAAKDKSIVCYDDYTVVGTNEKNVDSVIGGIFKYIIDKAFGNF